MGSMVSFTSPRVAEVVDEDARWGRTTSGCDPLLRHLRRHRADRLPRQQPVPDKRWDEELRLFVDGSDLVRSTRWTAGGTRRSARSSRSADGVADLEPGDRVWGTWGHRTGTVQQAERAAARLLAVTSTRGSGSSPRSRAIGLNVVLDADIHVGETVAVFGLGVPGQIVAQLARLNGARVIGVDGIAARRELATELGADVVLDAGEGEVAERIRELTGGRGADVCLEVTGNYRALHEAIRAVAYSSRVCAAGFMQGDGVGLRLGEEFHHNRVEHRLLADLRSRAGAPAPLGRLPAGPHRHRSRHQRAAPGAGPDHPHLPARPRQAPRSQLLHERPQQALQVVLSFEEVGA